MKLLMVIIAVLTLSTSIQAQSPEQELLAQLQALPKLQQVLIISQVIGEEGFYICDEPCGTNLYYTYEWENGYPPSDAYEIWITKNQGIPYLFTITDQDTINLKIEPNTDRELKIKGIAVGNSGLVYSDFSEPSDKEPRVLQKEN